MLNLRVELEVISKIFQRWFLVWSFQSSFSARE